MEKKLKEGLFGSRLPSQFDDLDKMFNGKLVHRFSCELIESINKEYREIALEQDAEDQRSWVNAARVYSG